MKKASVRRRPDTRIAAASNDVDGMALSGGGGGNIPRIGVALSESIMRVHVYGEIILPFAMLAC